MGWFILAVIVWIAALVGIVASFLADDEFRGGVRALAGVAVLAGFGLFAVAGLKSVPVKNIGVPQSFGAVGRTIYEPGIHETWTPWLHLTDIDETVQTTTFEGNDCLTVRIGGQQSACADITIQWQILPGAAGALFSDYANQGNFMTTVENAVAIREFKQVVNRVLGDYNPITDVQSVTGAPTSTSQFTQFANQILTQMQQDIGSRIDVKSVLMPFVHYDGSVESKLQAIQQAFANFAIAQENVKVSQEQARAYVNLGTPSLPELIAQCLTDVKENTSLPAGFTCFPGSGSGFAVTK